MTTMDSTVIQEIADQLGMAADQAGQFIVEQLPNYAVLKASQLGISLAVMWSLFVVLAAVSLTSIYLCSTWSKKAKADEKEYEKELRESRWSSSDKIFKTDIKDYIAYPVFAITGSIAILVLFVDIFATIIMAPDLYGWVMYPESMLIDMAIKAL